MERERCSNVRVILLPSSRHTHTTLLTYSFDSRDSPSSQTSSSTSSPSGSCARIEFTIHRCPVHAKSRTSLPHLSYLYSLRAPPVADCGAMSFNVCVCLTVSVSVFCAPLGRHADLIQSHRYGRWAMVDGVYDVMWDVSERRINCPAGPSVECTETESCRKLQTCLCVCDAALTQSDCLSVCLSDCLTGCLTGSRYGA